ncbi:hypothetical protein C8R47DRAFT_1120018 [Mycena vitilis]|nr:hypothetical protein C8R47DRAFT_1120018 [Mycena vitilis]
MSKKVVIVGGHGKISLRLARILGREGHAITSIIRNKAHADDVKAASATPLVLSLEDSPVAAFTAAFQGVDVVYFCAGAGSQGGERTSSGKTRAEAVDRDGAVKVFDAIQGVLEGVIKDVYTRRPRLILVSAIDVRDVDECDARFPNEPLFPAHYNEQDRQLSMRTREPMSRGGFGLGAYMKCKYEADMNLVHNTKSKDYTFNWTILRPGLLTDDPGTGKASIGRTRLMPPISRDDVATALAELLGREDAAGLAIDMVGGSTPIAKGLSAMIEKNENSKKSTGKTETDFPLDQGPALQLPEKQ